MNICVKKYIAVWIFNELESRTPFFTGSETSGESKITRSCHAGGMTVKQTVQKVQSTLNTNHTPYKAAIGVDLGLSYKIVFLPTWKEHTVLFLFWSTLLWLVDCMRVPWWWTWEKHSASTDLTPVSDWIALDSLDDKLQLTNSITFRWIEIQLS